MKNNQLNEKLNEVVYKDKRFNRPFVLLSEICNEFNFDFKKMVNSIKNINVKTNKISYPTSLLFQFSKDENKKLKEAKLSLTGLMLVLADYAKENDDEVAFMLAKAIKENPTNLSYPEQRLFCRKEYTEVTKNLRRKINKMYANDYYSSVKERLSLVYHTILQNYYGVTNINTIQTNKVGGTNKNYLDYISCRELKDLTEIQKRVCEALEKNPYADYIHIATVNALNRRNDFFEKAGYKYPLSYNAHSNKPLKMYKSYKKLLEELNLEDDDKILKNCLI